MHVLIHFLYLFSSAVISWLFEICSLIDYCNIHLLFFTLSFTYLLTSHSLSCSFVPFTAFCSLFYLSPPPSLSLWLLPWQQQTRSSRDEIGVRAWQLCVCVKWKGAAGSWQMCFLVCVYMWMYPACFDTFWPFSSVCVIVCFKVSLLNILPNPTEQSYKWPSSTSQPSEHTDEAAATHTRKITVVIISNATEKDHQKNHLLTLMSSKQKNTIK